MEAEQRSGARSRRPADRLRPGPAPVASSGSVALRLVAGPRGFDRRYNFHALRHSAVTNVYRASRNLFLAQRFARHASPLTTIVYTHPADEELAAGVRDLPC